MLETITVDGRTLRIDPQLKAAVEKLRGAKGFAYLHKYQCGNGGVRDFCINTGQSVRDLYRRRIDQLEAISFGDFLRACHDESLLTTSAVELLTQFDERKERLIQSYEKTIAGDRSDNHRRAHDVFYATVSPGVVLHLQTEQDWGGDTVLVRDNGLPIVESIMLAGSVINEKVHVPPVYKPVKHGVPVKISKVLDSMVNKRSVSYKRFSLKPDKFESLSVANTGVTEPDVTPSI